MVSVGLQLMGYTLALLGTIGTLTATLMPNWKNSSYIGSSIVTAVGFTRGLWMECAIQSTGITQCDIYNSLLDLPSDLRAAQAMMATSAAVSTLACIISVVGMRCTIFAQGSPAKDRVAVIGGVIFVLGGLLCFIPVVWNIHVVLRDFYNPMIPDSMKYEIGEALYLGIMSALVSLIGGFILCASCPPRNQQLDFQSIYQSRPLAAKSPRPSISHTLKSPRPSISHTLKSPRPSISHTLKSHRPSISHTLKTNKSEFNSYNLTGYV
ncbi:claudin-2 isoform X1 [Alligator sinensis]|uniref:Claudin-2 isoform X1 n=2 Tax=Alligator TaxID=8495 RepID=A0A3Q0FSG5_ALLSI|nr:claudin-2 isoform X1 [Alligator sinensis]